MPVISTDSIGFRLLNPGSGFLKGMFLPFRILSASSGVMISPASRHPLPGTYFGSESK